MDTTQNKQKNTHKTNTKHTKHTQNTKGKLRHDETKMAAWT
jgi:hypothetical protein